MLKTTDYQILTKQEVQKLYQNFTTACQKKAAVFVQTHLTNFINNTSFINKLSFFFLFCMQHNVPPVEVNTVLSRIQTLNDLKKELQEIKQSFKKKKADEKFFLLKGNINRFVQDWRPAPLFEKQNRIYIKINPILSTRLFVFESVKNLNVNLPIAYQITVSAKEKINKSNSTTNTEQYFLSQAPHFQPMKIGRFLENTHKQVSQLLFFLTHEEPATINSFFQLINNHINPNNKLQSDLNSFFKNHKQPVIKMSPLLFFFLKKQTFNSLDETIKKTSKLEQQVHQTKKEVQHQQVRLSLNNLNDTSANIILLSTLPKDIMRMSEYADWETCMSYDGERSFDIPFQIGYGSIVAYLIHQDNPHKKLGRILLKPFVNKAGLDNQVNRNNLFYQKEKTLMKNIDQLIDYSISHTDFKKKYRILTQKLKRVSMKPDASHQAISEIYLADTQFGLQNSSFASTLLKFVEKELNPSPLDGCFYAKGNFHREDLSNAYFFSNPADKNNLITFLKMRGYPYHQSADKKFTAGKYIFAGDTPNVNFSGLKASYLTMHAKDLKLIDERGLKTDTLILVKCNDLTVIPPNVKITERLTLDDLTTKSLPQGIETKELVVFSPTVSIVPNDIKVQTLDIINTNIKVLPNLKLKSLCAKNSQLQDLSNVEINDYLDVSSTPIQKLPEQMSLNCLLVRNCKNLKKLPKQLSVQSLDISGTNIQNIPETDYEWLCISNTTLISSLPENISFSSLDADNSALNELKDNICAKHINISKTNIQQLPKNLSAKELVMNNTNISELATDLKSDDIYAKNTLITTLPSNLNVKRLNLKNSPVHTVHYSKHFLFLTFSKLPKYIHPALSPFIFSGFETKDVLNSQKNYEMRYLQPLTIQKTHSKNQIKLKTVISHNRD